MATIFKRQETGSSDPREPKASGYGAKVRGCRCWALKILEILIVVTRRREIERKRNIKLERKGSKTGPTKKLHFKFITYMERVQLRAAEMHQAERVC